MNKTLYYLIRVTGLTGLRTLVPIDAQPSPTPGTSVLQPVHKMSGESHQRLQGIASTSTVTCTTETSPSNAL